MEKGEKGLQDKILEDPKLKLLQDKFWRLNHLYQIRNKAMEKVQFKLNKPQEHFVKNRSKRAIICKSRQLGFSTLMCLVQLDKVLFTPNSNCLMISYNKDSAEDLFQKIVFAWNNFPAELKFMWKVDTERKNQLTFNFGDGSISTIAVRQSGRSGNYDEIHISELAKLSRLFPNRANEIVQGTIPAAGIHTNITIESTPEGMGVFQDMFWQGWKSKETNDLTFKSFFYNWQWEEEEIGQIATYDVTPDLELMEYQAKHDERAEKDPDLNKINPIELKYYYTKFLQMNKKWKRLRQEYPTTVEEAFMEAASLLFDNESISQQNKYLEDGKEKGNWIVYEEPDIKHAYTISCDVAEGVGQDSSTAVIIDWHYDKPKVVATYADNEIPPDLFAWEIKKYAELYNMALVAIERNNHGLATIITLKNNYNRIYKEEHLGKVKKGQTGKYGWHTNLATKPKMMYELSEAITDEDIVIPSRDILNELRTYNKENLMTVKFDEEATRHWDLLIALAIGWQMRTQPYARRNQVTQQRRDRGRRRRRTGYAEKPANISLKMSGY